jgi:hypothetical protein
MACAVFSFLFLCACSNGRKGEKAESKTQRTVGSADAIDNQLLSLKNVNVTGENLTKKEAGIFSKEEKRKIHFQKMERRVLDPYGKAMARLLDDNKIDSGAGL